MSLVRVLDTLETDRLVLRHSRVGEAAIYRQLWTERDLRVPPHRRINSEGRPTVEDIAAQSVRSRGQGFLRWSGRARPTSSGIAG
jgi:[ribosomal protein S5]-alanine N-acetyltransferase